jgi:hypothetical protein
MKASVIGSAIAITDRLVTSNGRALDALEFVGLDDKKATLKKAERMPHFP